MSNEMWAILLGNGGAVITVITVIWWRLNRIEARLNGFDKELGRTRERVSKLEGQRGTH